MYDKAGELDEEAEVLQRYIRKDIDDIAQGTVTWEKVQKLLSGLLVGNFNNENGGSWTPDAEGRSHLITDYLEVRMKAPALLKKVQSSLPLKNSLTLLTCTTTCATSGS